MYRKVIDSGLIGDPHLFQLFCYLLITAAHKPYCLTYRGNVINLNPGELFTSLRHLSSVLGSSIKIVRKRLDILRKMGTLGTQTAHGGTVVTICKWNTYQSGEDDKGTGKGKRRANAGQTQGKHKAQDQEAKKEKNAKNEKKKLPYPSSRFRKAWEDYLIHREQIKSKMTPLAIDRALKKLARYESEEVAIRVIDQSIENGWKGLFNLKDELTQRQREEARTQARQGQQFEAEMANRILELGREGMGQQEARQQALREWQVQR